MATIRGRYVFAICLVALLALAMPPANGATPASVVVLQYNPETATVWMNPSGQNPFAPNPTCGCQSFVTVQVGNRTISLPAGTAVPGHQRALYVVDSQVPISPALVLDIDPQTGAATAIGVGLWKNNSTPASAPASAPTLTSST